MTEKKTVSLDLPGEFSRIAKQALAAVNPSKADRISIEIVGDAAMIDTQVLEGPIDPEPADPETDTPDTESPDTESPDTESPDTESADTSESTAENGESERSDSGVYPEGIDSVADPDSHPEGMDTVSDSDESDATDSLNKIAQSIDATGGESKAEYLAEKGVSNEPDRSNVEREAPAIEYAENRGEERPSLEEIPYKTRENTNYFKVIGLLRRTQGYVTIKEMTKLLADTKWEIPRSSLNGSVMYQLMKDGVVCRKKRQAKTRPAFEYQLTQLGWDWIEAYQEKTDGYPLKIADKIGERQFEILSDG